MIPVLLLTGFLGSGKTTLLNHLLEGRPGSGPFSEGAGKLALLVNEFGDVGIDGDLLPPEMTRQIEIKGGCICCRLDEDLEKTLIELIDSQPELSAIIIETTGIAEPLPISWTLARDALGERLRLAAVITVVDALEHEKHRPLSPSVDAQVEYADLLVVTKLDLAGPERLAELETLLRETNQVAPIISGPAAELVTELWRALDDPSFESQRPTARAGERSDHAFESVVVPIENTLEFETLTDSLEALPARYLRVKGIARAVDESSGSDEAKMIAFHRVGARVSAEPAREGLAPRMVVIGHDIDPAELRDCVAKAVIESSE